MRIATGLLKGLYIQPLKDIRCTQDKVKNSVFNILGESIQDAKFLELFAGTGIVGFEAISRGASEVVFVENNPVCFRFIKDTMIKVSSRIRGRDIQIFKQDAIKAIEKFHAEKTKFDIVFADPPYFQMFGNYQKRELTHWAKKTLQTLGHYDIINPSGVVIIQVHRKEILAESYASLTLIRSYKYGDTVLLVYQKK